MQSSIYYVAPYLINLKNKKKKYAIDSATTIKVESPTGIPYSPTSDVCPHLRSAMITFQMGQSMPAHHFTHLHRNLYQIL